MSAITPDTDVILLKVPLEITQENQLTFANATAQYNYFHGLTGSLELQDFTYQRKDGVIRCGVLADDLYQYNYVMYRNNGFSNKWFYAFIDKVEYLNHNTSAISIRTDVWQTWQFDLTYKPTFVEREHVNDDTIGLHTVPEGLDLGEYLIKEHTQLNIVNEQPSSGVAKWWVCFAVTNPPYNSMTLPDSDHLIGDTPTGLYHFAVPADASLLSLGTVLLFYNAAKDGIVPEGVTADAIVNIYMIPHTCVDRTSHQTWTHTYEGGTPLSVDVYSVINKKVFSNVAITQSNTLAGSFTPKNKKLFTYPFSYLYVSNKSGQDVIYKWEDGKTNSSPASGKTGQEYKFDTALVPTASLSAKLYPTTYKGITISTPSESPWNYGISYGKLPVCAWITDAYTNWLTQNGVNIATNILTSAATGAIHGGVAGAGINSAFSITNALAETVAAQKVPDQAHGDVNVGDALFATTECSISAYSMTVRPEMASIIDNYFQMYGYKVNSVKVPNVTGRTNWNYVKTIGCYIKADIPQEDLKEIKDMFNNGVTFWHNPSTFADYSQSNAIVTP